LSAKRELRDRLRKVLADITAEQLAAKSELACRKLVERPEYRKAQTIMVFLSLAHEVDTTPLVLHAWQHDKRVLAPKVSWDQRRMIPVEIRSLTDDLAAGLLGVREPLAGAPYPIDLIDLVVVPGLAFDAYGNRLGRGRGFYDRFLSNPELKAVACALAIEEQVVDSLPTGPGDRRVHMLVTDQNVRVFDK